MYLELDHLKKHFDGREVVRDLSLTLEQGQLLCILGASGCGKTTTLNMIGGFLEPDSGRVRLDGEDITRIPPEQRPVTTVFQSYGLFPHMTVLQNVIYGLKFRGVKREQARQKGMRYLDMVGLGDYASAYIQEISGGQQQRVALARALIVEPKLCLLDEPFCNLDAALRTRMRHELKRLQKDLGLTMVFVTHDQEEALTMSDTVVVMNEGRIQQIGTPQDIYNEPKNAFVADFIGESNIIDGIMHEDRVVGMYGKKFPCLDGGFQPNEPVDVVIRPEDIDIVPVEQGQLTGTVTEVTFKGMHYDIIVDFKGFKWLIQTTDFSPVGARIGVKIDPDGFHIMKKSRYSGMFGDYSSYSSEYDELNEGPEEGIEDEE